MRGLLQIACAEARRARGGTGERETRRTCAAHVVRRTLSEPSCKCADLSGERREMK